MRNLKLTIHYDGTNYHGWQSQPGMATIQETVEAAIERLTCQKAKLTGSSRTDAGVHALGQVASFLTDSPAPVENICRALNQILPQDIAIAEAVEVPDVFDAIKDTVSKRYRYTIFTGRTRPVHHIRTCWHRPGRLNVDDMHQAAQMLLGQHNFKSFASAADQRQSSIRTISKCEVSSSENWVYIDVAADGFLYNMVRNIVGTLVEIGRGRWTPDQMRAILDAKDRTAAGPIAPASGLCLMEIFYP